MKPVHANRQARHTNRQIDIKIVRLASRQSGWQDDGYNVFFFICLNLQPLGGQIINSNFLCMDQLTWGFTDCDKATFPSQLNFSH